MNKKPKIALISNTSNFFNFFALNHIEHLSKNYDLFICCNDPIDLKKKVPKNVSFVNLKFKRNISILNDIVSFLMTLFFFLKEKPILSISFTPKVGLIVAIVSFIAKTPVQIHWFTGQVWATKNGLSRIILKYIDKIIFHLSDKILIDSISQRKFLLKEKVFSKKNSFVLHKGSVWGVDLKKFKFNKKKRIQLRNKYSISKNTFVFLYLGRINKDKGIDDLINAFNKINKLFDIMLIFVGPVEEKKYFNKLKNQKKILHIGYTKKPEYWFSMTDVLCLPSYREGFGTVIIEAAACGIPTLCSKIYGLKDAIDEYKTGFFHKVGSLNDIERKMLYIIKNKKLTKKYGYLARTKVVNNFDQNILSKKLLKFVNSLID